MELQDSIIIVNENDKNLLSYESVASYQVDKTTFIVDRVFQKDGAESIGSILIKLIKSDIDSL